MNQSIQKQMNQLLRDRGQHKRWLALVLCLALLSGLGTTAMLTYTGQTLTYQKKVLDCTYTAPQGPGYAGYSAHVHNEDCYDNGELVCPLPEIPAHYHSDACYRTDTHLVCTLEENDGHVHSEACWGQERGALVCTDESEEHEHSDDCYEWNPVLVCGQEEGAGAHRHGESCYETTRTLVCGLDEIHIHNANCYDEAGNLICGKPFLEVHVHDENCFEIVELTREEVEALGEEPTDTTGERPTETAGDPAETDGPKSDNADTETDPTAEPSEEEETEPADEIDDATDEETAAEESDESDPTADVETAADWNAIFGDRLYSGVWADDLLEVVGTQLGYRESSRNFVQDEFGKRGYTRYGGYYGDPYGDWCAMFLSFCMDYANIPAEAFPRESSCRRWVEALRERGMFQEKGNYEPVPGDLIFYDNNNDGFADHVGIVETVEAGETWYGTIEGNRTDKVDRFVIQRNDLAIFGFGVLPENPNLVEDEEEITTDPTDEEEITTDPADEEEITTDPADEEENAPSSSEEDNSLATVTLADGEALPEGVTAYAFQVFGDEAENAESLVEAWLTKLEQEELPLLRTFQTAASAESTAVPMADETTADESLPQSVEENSEDAAPAEEANVRSETRYQVFEIGLEQVVVEEYETSEETVTGEEGETSEQAEIPEGSFRVSVTLPEPINGRDFALYHIGENGVEELTLELSYSDESVIGFSFTTDSFSPFVLRYTVDFFYEAEGVTYSYSLTGDEYVELSDLVEALGILADTDYEYVEDFLADVESVEFSNPELVQVLKNWWDNGWRLTSLAPFLTEETLTITMVDGTQFVVKVTDAQIKKNVLASDGLNYTVTVTFGDETGIPADADLDVEEILVESESYEDYVLKTENALHIEEGMAAGYIRLFNISIVDKLDHSIKYQPNEGTTVEVVVELDDSESEDLRVVHFADINDEGDLVDAEVDGQSVTFEASGFSVYAITGPEVALEFRTAEGETLNITVTFDKNEQLPEDAWLEVTELQEGDEGWFERSLRLSEVLYENFENVLISDARFLCIRILTEDGEYEPEYPVRVKIDYDTVFSTERNPELSFEHLDGEPEYIPEDEPNRFAAVHYTGDEAQLLEADVTRENEGIIESTMMTPSFSDYDVVYFYEIDPPEPRLSYSLSSGFGTHSAADVAAAIVGAEEESMVLFAAGSRPGHAKTLTDNNNGTYTIGLNVTGDADTSQKASNVNVIIVCDVSKSMTMYNVPSDTGRYGRANGNYFPLYRYQNNGNRYTQLTDDTYTGTVYSSNHGGVYTGQRYARIRRADATEKVLYDFTNALFAYQDQDNPTNIQVALSTFSTNAHAIQSWTSTKNDITGKVSSTGAYNSAKLSYSSGTNWEAALQEAQRLLNNKPDEDPTYVIFITDGAPTLNNGTSTISTAYQTHYNAARDEASAIQQTTDGKFYSIYAYGDEADWLASLMYYSHNNANPPANTIGTTFDTEGYYNAGDTSALNAAINDIFHKIVQTLGVGAVSIADGTTSYVQTSSSVAHLLEVDESSYQYWLTIPVTAGTGGAYTFIMPDKLTGDDVTYTAAVSGNNITITWGDNNSVTYKGAVNAGSTMTLQWEQANSFYNYAPPAASFNNLSSAVDWNLNSVGTLLDGVTYTVTFDCYPSQETMDLIADLKNGYVQYADVDPEIQRYLSSDYRLATNTSATLTYTDSRTEDGEQTIDYVNPDPQPVSATEQVVVSKNWSNTLDGRDDWKAQSISLYVTRDGVERNYVTLNAENNWSSAAWISYGIMTVDANGNIDLKTTGHDFSFSEEVDVGYYWQIKADTVHPMLINNQVTMLKLIDTADAPDAIKNASADNARATVGSDTYYKLTINGTTKYYVVGDGNAVLNATNHRRSYLDVQKTVTGGNVPEGDTFEFTMTVATNVEGANPADVNSDAYVWVSIWDTVHNAQVTDPDAVEADGLRWQLNDESVVTAKPAASDFNGYFCAPSGAALTVQMQNGYNLRFLNLPVGATYTISESETMPNDGYQFISVEGERGFDADQDPDTADDWTTEEAGDAAGQTITGTIDYVESAYKVTVTNAWETIDIQLKKVDENREKLDGSTFTLTSGETAIGTYQPGTVTTVDEETETETTVDNGNPLDLGGLGIGIYKLEETVVPQYFEKAEVVYFEVYRDTADQTLKARLVDKNGSPLSDQSMMTVEDSVYTITVTNTRTPYTVTIIKNVEGTDADKAAEYSFSATGLEEESFTLIGSDDEKTADTVENQIVFENVLSGTVISITELFPDLEEGEDAPFDTVIEISNETEPVEDARVETGDVIVDGDITITFTNTRNRQPVSVWKTDLSHNTLTGASFTLYKAEDYDDEEHAPKSDTTPVVPNAFVNTDGILTLGELPVGEYRLIETQAPDGYMRASSPITINVSNNLVTAMQDTRLSEIYRKGDEYWVEGQDDDTWQIRVWNNSGVLLPRTGGPGTGWLTLFGTVLAALSGTALILSRGTHLLPSLRRRIRKEGASE